MKRQLILTSLALLSAMPPALAWPFDKKFTGATSTYAVYPGFRCMPFRSGGGSLMQIFLGGPEVISLNPVSDGAPNLAEYFYGTNPKLGEAASNNFFGLTMFPPATRTSPVNFRLFASTVALADPKLSVRVQYATSNLNAAWSDLSTYTGGGTWTGVVPTVLPPAAGRSNVSFVTSITPLTTPKFFLRLNLEELP